MVPDALWVGSLVFLILGLIVYCSLNVYIGSLEITKTAKFENKSIACVSVTSGTICMWLLWICTYMHQMHPLIRPILEHHS